MYITCLILAPVLALSESFPVWSAIFCPVLLFAVFLLYDILSFYYLRLACQNSVLSFSSLPLLYCPVRTFSSSCPSFVLPLSCLCYICTAPVLYISMSYLVLSFFLPVQCPCILLSCPFLSSCNFLTCRSPVSSLSLICYYCPHALVLLLSLPFSCTAFVIFLPWSAIFKIFASLPFVLSIF